DLPSLFHNLAEQLRTVEQFDGLFVVLYDEKRHVMRLHLLETTVTLEGQLVIELPVEASPAGLVWQTQQPLLVTDPTLYETRYPQIVAEWRAYRVKTCCLLPLISAGRCLGALGFASLREMAWSEADQDFLQQVATLVAVAVDNAINFDE